MKKKSDNTQLERRDFLKMAIVGGSALMMPGGSTFAGPFAYYDMKHLVPADKKLSKEWLQSLVVRGKPEVYSSLTGEQKYIGMPVGGIACGQLYLGGDGRLWLWRIFKTEYDREKIKTADNQFRAKLQEENYANPELTFDMETRSVDQGTVIRVSSDKNTSSRTLDNKGFKDIDFRGEYPIGKVAYKDEEFPVEVKLEAFSPFIPLNSEESSLPLTIMSYTVTNRTDKKVRVEIAKWLKNAVCPYLDDPVWGNRKNILQSDDSRISIVGSVENGETLNAAGEKLSGQHGYGSMALSLLNCQGKGKVSLSVPDNTKPEELISKLTSIDASEKEQLAPFENKMIGAVSEEFELEPGDSKTVDFCISWYFPYLNQQENESGWLLGLNDIKYLKKHYYNRFDSAGEVAAYMQSNFNFLAGSTRSWNKVWYDSSLPYWLLDRSFIPIDCLATNTVMWFNNGRFWGWEGVYCCPGTCKHVWHYAQAMARIFPEIERYLRQEVDYKISMDEDGGLWHRDETRGEYGKVVAQDGHCGTIIRAYREHKMSATDQFLKTNYSKIKKSIEFIINEDVDKDGLLEGEQHNTLDSSWFGPMGWISSLYIASLAAGKEMALEMGDIGFANKCDDLVKKGRENIVKELFNGEYFIHIPDPNHPEALNSNDGCHIDQVLGQSLAFQAGIPQRIVPEKECKSALESIWKYNFAPDAYMYQEKHEFVKGARIYATAGEAGTIMCTWPKGGAEKAIPKPGDPNKNRSKRDETIFGRYFDECMNGFEYQVASHMINEGMVTKGLAITKAVHERYGAMKRNPYNEIECGDHYSRSMASYGTYTAVCGFDYHGPKSQLSFNPKLSPENFKSAFVTAEGWGSFTQKIDSGKQIETLELHYGKLPLNQFDFYVKKGESITSLAINEVMHSDYKLDPDSGRVSVFLNNKILQEGQKLQLSVILG